jgi:hypothetical protein
VVRGIMLRDDLLAKRRQIFFLFLSPPHRQLS